MNKLLRRMACWPAVIIFGSLTALNADTIYNNSTNDLLTRFNPGTLEVGDEIILAGSARYLTNFSFEFWGTNTANPGAFSGTVTATVRFYLNDGPLFNGYATPGTLVYSSGSFSIIPTARSTLTFKAGSDFPLGGLFLGSGPGGTLLTNLTWSVQFAGMGLTDSAGVDIYSPPVVGGEHTDYWEYNGIAWSLKTNSVPMDFAAVLQASAPEPAPFVLSILGGMGLLLWRSRRSRKA
jgi:hypothetical protein